MDISIFHACGPVMIGPSSSHTAGAVKLGRIGRKIVPGGFSHVSFGLHGSFAKTYKGHGTDRALVAGTLGYMEDDERIARSFAYAEEAGLGFDFYETELDGMHENSVKMTFTMLDGSKNEIVGSSVGGGEIVIRGINGVETEFSANSCTLIIRQQDKKGVLSDVTRLLAQGDINIGVMKLSRNKRGDMAFCIIEIDRPISNDELAALRQINHVLDVQALQLTGNGGE